MIQTQPKHLRILGIAPTTRGIGFAVLEGEDSLVDYGCKSAKGDKNAQSVAIVKKLILQYRPDVIVSQNTLIKGSHRVERIQELTGQIITMAKAHQIKVSLISFKQVKQTYFDHGLGTKHEIVEILAKRFPELADRLPPKRRPWTSEDSRTSIFDAVALIFAHKVSVVVI